MGAKTTAEKRFDTPEYVIVPAIASKTLDTLNAALPRPDVGDAAKALRERASDGAKLSAACAGPWCWLSMVCSTSSAQPPNGGLRQFSDDSALFWHLDTAARELGIGRLGPSGSG